MRVLAQWRAFDEPATAQAAQTLLSSESWLRSASVVEAAAALGWVVTDFDPEWPDLGAFLDTGHGLGPMSAFFDTDDNGRVQSISMNLTERLPAGDPEVAAFKQDAFASAAAVLTGLFGRPTDSFPGAEPQLWWRREATALGLITKDDTVGLQFTPQELMVGEWG
ncbi:DUF6301 family protein [Actinoplanes oblitus]|uniref:DUF6301 family protein n=1 Tax=Actinoplanes oblitus TaxID=3040509 RepID=A0ABY8WSE9_9ACTN|nr:DUF6301 family protein [Actinoplanes oblitus]WIM99931.1 DUF6301 family protein [Actinoplanes oblitus]